MSNYLEKLNNIEETSSLEDIINGTQGYKVIQNIDNDTINSTISQLQNINNLDLIIVRQLSKEDKQIIDKQTTIIQEQENINRQEQELANDS